jgi:hypothetical protein
MTTLSEIISDIHQNRKTGLLSITIRGDNNQFKMFFKDGDIYHITCGGQKNSDCIKNCIDLDFSVCFFVPNVKLDAVNANLPAISDIIQIFKSKGIAVEIKQPDGSGPPAAAAGTSDFGRIREELKVAFIRQIGPAGGKILSKIIDEKWRVSSPSKADLVNLISLLKGEIEDGENRKLFVSEAEKIIL